MPRLSPVQIAVVEVSRKLLGDRAYREALFDLGLSEAEYEAIRERSRSGQAGEPVTFEDVQRYLWSRDNALHERSERRDAEEDAAVFGRLGINRGE